MSNFTGVTFAQQKVLPSDDAIIRRNILSDGILYGCEFSYSGSTLTMGAGQLLICGRQIRHPSAQNWAVTDATSGFARLVLTVDLTKTASKDVFEQVLDSIQYASSKDGFPSLNQSDVNTIGSVYQIAACTVSLGAGGITGIVDQVGPCEVAGGGGLNFKVVGGLTQPTDPAENTIWVNTGVTIASWHFGVREPNVYKLSTRTASDVHTIIAPHKLAAGDILNFEIPATVHVTKEAICIKDPVTNRNYYVRNLRGEAVTGWTATVKVGVEISNVSHPIGSYGSGAGTAYLRSWDKYYHKEGTVWFNTSDSSPVSFNALKKQNGIEVCPVSAQIYTSGAWSEKEAKTYKNGAWVEWIPSGALYYNGDEFESVTGGWALSTIYNNNYGNHGDSVVKNSGSMIFESHFRAGVGFACGFLRPNNKIDLKGVNSLELTVTSVEIDDATMPILLCVKNTDSIHNQDMAASVALTAGGQQTVTLDVSSLTGSYYVGIGAHNNSGGKVEIEQLVRK